MWLGVRVCVQNTPTYNSLTATTHPRGFTFVSAFGTAALPTLDRSDPRDLPFDHTMTDFLNCHPEIIVILIVGLMAHQLGSIYYRYSFCVWNFCWILNLPVWPALTKLL